MNFKTNKSKFFEQIYADHSLLLENLGYENDRKILISFSGVPGSGKTTLARKIEDKFHAVRINNDEIREIAAKHLSLPVPDPQVHSLAKEYLFYLIEKLSKGPNHFIILDSSIDRSYKTVKEWVDTNNFDLIVIRFDLDKQEIVRRINARNGVDAKYYLESLDRQWEDYLNFNQIYKADIIYNSNDEEVFRFLERNAENRKQEN